MNSVDILKSEDRDQSVKICLLCRFIISAEAYLQSGKPVCPTCSAPICMDCVDFMDNNGENLFCSINCSDNFGGEQIL
jgi:hypothetical protein